jgi:hypothetical protein
MAVSLITRYFLVTVRAMIADNTTPPHVTGISEIVALKRVIQHHPYGIIRTYVVPMVTVARIQQCPSDLPSL